MKHIYQTIIIIASYLVASVALAHGNHEIHSAHGQAFMSGLLHPFSGFDHLLAILFVGLLLQQSRLPISKSITALITLMAVGAASGLLLNAQAWLETAILMSLAAMFMLLWIKPAQIQSLILSVCSIAIIIQGWAHGSFISGTAFSTFNEMQFIGGVIASSLLLLIASTTAATLMTQIRHPQHVK